MVHSTIFYDNSIICQKKKDQKPETFPPGLRPTLGHPGLLHAGRAAACGDGRCCSHRSTGDGGVPDAFGPPGTVPCPGTGGWAAARPGGEWFWKETWCDITNLQTPQEISRPIQKQAGMSGSGVSYSMQRVWKCKQSRRNVKKHKEE